MSENLYSKNQKVMDKKTKKKFDQIRWNCKECGNKECECKKKEKNNV